MILFNLKESLKSYSKVKHLPLILKQKYNDILSKYYEIWLKILQEDLNTDVEIIYNNKYFENKMQL